MIRGGDELLHLFFNALGYEVTAVRHPFDENHPKWNYHLYYTVTLRHLLHEKQFTRIVYIDVCV